MVITVTVANESNSDYSYHGTDRYFLSQGRTVDSAKKNMYKFLCKKYNFFEYETLNSDVSELLHIQFSRQWCEGECWADLFPNFTFIRANRAGVIEISKELYDMIMENA